MGMGLWISECSSAKSTVAKNVLQGEQLQCTAHTWLSPRHVLVAAEKGKVIHDDDDEDAEDVNDDSEGEDDFTAN